MELIEENIPVLVDFYADWCEPCKWVEPVLDEVNQATKGKLSIKKINIENHPQLAEDHQIRSVPTLVLFKNNKEVWRMNGFMLAPDLVKKLEQYIAQA